MASRAWQKYGLYGRRLIGKELEQVGTRIWIGVFSLLGWLGVLPYTEEMEIKRAEAPSSVGFLSNCMLLVALC
jgi:hypothetical protein